MKKAIVFSAVLAIFASAVAYDGMRGKKPKEQPVFIYEAEAGVLDGVVQVTQTEGYSGDGYVSGFDKPDDAVTLSLNIPSAGMYHLRIGYSAPSGDKNTSLSINGEPFGEVKLPLSTAFTEAEAGRVPLKQGDNTIRLTSHWNWYDIDYIKIQSAATETKKRHQVGKRLVNPHASAEAKALMGFLVDEYGKHILSGQQEIYDAMGVKVRTGKFPAVVGFDFMDYSPSRVEHGSHSIQTEDAIDWHNRLGGIVTFCWHWNAPKDLIDSGVQPWSKGFYTEATTFDVANAMNNPESEDYRLIIRDIDAIAEQLQKLQKAKVPVLWRPLHEAEGGWFWWGAKGPDPAKKLYRLLYERLTGVHHLDNLIWIWNSESPDWYPGDDVVDIISIDSYPKAGDYSAAAGRYDKLVDLVRDKKLVALTENGPIPDPKLLQTYNAHWSWFCTWNGNFITDGIQNSAEHVAAVYNDPYVLTLDELPETIKFPAHQK